MLTPMDIHNVEFKRSFKGYDPEEVDDFLATIVIKYETVYQENRKLQAELKRLRQEAEGKVDHEQDALDLISLTKQTVEEVKVMAEREATNMVSVAESEAQRIVSEARLKAQHVLSDAEDRLQKTQRTEARLREKVRLTMETIWNVLEDKDESTPKTRLYREVEVEPILEGKQDENIDSEDSLTSD